MGRSGLRVSRLGLGTMMWGRDTDEHEAREQLADFVEAGGTLVDTASTYGGGASEELLGSLLGDVVDRSDVVLCTKAGLRREDDQRVVDASRRSLLGALDTSLARLRTDHVDLFLVHAFDPDVPLEETLDALARHPVLRTRPVRGCLEPQRLAAGPGREPRPRRRAAGRRPGRAVAARPLGRAGRAPGRRRGGGRRHRVVAAGARAC